MNYAPVRWWRGWSSCVVRPSAPAEAPISLWRDVARWLVLLAEPGDSEAAVLQPLVPDVADLLERPVGAAPRLDPAAAQARLFAVLARLLRRAGTRPLAILLEDLHWADDNSLELLTRLARHLTDLPLLVVGTYRQDETPELAARLKGMQPLNLHRLGRPSIADSASRCWVRPGFSHTW